MLQYIIRLDDANPMMNKKSWRDVEVLLDKYNIKPLVGIIPDCQDDLFVWEKDKYFWEETVARWIRKGWTIAQHGFHHVYHDCGDGRHSEYIGLDYNEQRDNILSGYNIMVQNGCKPTCFFAPGHSFDSITVDVCRDLGVFDYISDGYAFLPYKQNGMIFLPCVYDTPHAIFPFGVYTFIMHPSFSTEEGLAYYDKFFKKHHNRFISADEVFRSCNKKRERNRADKLLEKSIFKFRNIRKR